MRYYWPALSFALAAFAPVAPAQDASGRVSVYGAHQGGNVVYHYQLRNAGAGEVRRFYIGCDCRSPQDTGIPELQTLPVGAYRLRTDDFGTWYELPRTSATQPPGWRVRVLRPEGARGHWIEWSAVAAGAARGAASQTFSVTVPRADPTYLTARFAIPAGSGAARAVSAPLQLADTTPPTLALTADTVSDVPGETARVRVNAVATDDRDPEPIILVESVDRPDGDAGRSGYQVVYSATDASGNRATNSAWVPAPAQRERAAPTPRLPRRASLP